MVSTSQAPTQKCHWLTGIHAGRGLAAVAVVITHGIAHPFPGAPGVAHLLGRYGVTLFFVISGFIMIASTGSGPFDPARFLRHRIRRVVPLYWLVTLVVAVTTIVAARAFKTTAFDIEHILKSMFFIPYYSDGRIFPFFRLGWTLNFEMFFYLIFALAFPLTAKMRALAVSAVLFAFYGAGQVFTFSSAPAVFYTRVDTIAFIAGMWVALWARHGRALDRNAQVALAAASAVIIAVIAWFYEPIKENDLTQLALIIACAMQAMILSTLPSSTRFPRLILFTGDASYSIYLWHMFGVGAVTALIRRLAPSLLVPGMALATFAGLAVGMAVYILIEAPLNRRLRRDHAPLQAAAGTV
ncbi:acyltransferase family protein [Sphingomonas sp. ID0503]|uniref:acyltransferase family protein n=1 Tax=Sphingomonas sp. ID0503 TaxID=3399691 RepID=UPI003AFB5F80